MPALSELLHEPVAAPVDEPRVLLHDVSHQFPGSNLLFQHVTAPLYAGHVYTLTGPSGSGKSTLLSIIAGWTQPTQGYVQRDADSWICCAFPSAAPRPCGSSCSIACRKHALSKLC
ncbi:ATP-binding cassette domain-containing protein [Bifidobacterium gallicum]|uniref:ABC transporter, ATP-binding protein n=1 Tax=Bifidobacterium gallicum DSM 20093 = LMG 11596 TaxID=561180 RepID=D1NUS8_9BIFI|nr:ATP-binding cassette domain-containing protein [Bifidobacterium gallicum]EFA22579.1 hypothetical protein BIFGAL_03605 [Bifidobacterium gallicum DSM 20093 = LMG 11596]KFI59567.1 ABC transporter, ATP-binding protein [Bifidobacterium gallicum DSM 20093 = LMG 11596]